MGGRIASQVMAAREDGTVRARREGLVFLGYPLHPPGNPAKLRVEHLRAHSKADAVCAGNARRARHAGRDQTVRQGPSSRPQRFMRSKAAITRSRRRRSLDCRRSRSSKLQWTRSIAGRDNLATACGSGGEVREPHGLVPLCLQASDKSLSIIQHEVVSYDSRDFHWLIPEASVKSAPAALPSVLRSSETDARRSPSLKPRALSRQSAPEH